MGKWLLGSVALLSACTIPAMTPEEVAVAQRAGNVCTRFALPQNCYTYLPVKQFVEIYGDRMSQQERGDFFIAQVLHGKRAQEQDQLNREWGAAMQQFSNDMREINRQQQQLYQVPPPPAPWQQTITNCQNTYGGFRCTSY